ncbi:hypothetical protein [Paenibacillus jilunlii]|uniref:Uncharacterized protein n=1 Tax=Paenibacillus jilunlii TaxID=682956 RepID=A0A1G9S133_9BACL|nr:hypothetical protein [Paenibacillus jilunlii]KWX77727.1 hypothetical protein AML91_06775 [Paenibacillus jilunlii]SDM29176.1 hypothetical protein SAMN05216191_1118 [Paenibacillus jilunlii]
MNMLTGQEGQNMLRLPKYDRTIFDYAIIIIGYLFMPLGLVLALIRFMGSHFKNYRKPANISLLYHVFVGGFVQMMVLVIYMTSSDAVDTATLITMLILFTVLLLLPASGFAASAAKARFKFSQLAQAYVQLINANGVRYLGNLSEQTGQSESDVRRDILYLQSHGVLAAELVINEGRTTAAPQEHFREGLSSLPGSAGGQAQPVPQPAAAPVPPQLPKSVRCPGCGAQNTVSPGQSKNCDYCGTTIAYS